MIFVSNTGCSTRTVKSCAGRPSSARSWPCSPTCLASKFAPEMAHSEAEANDILKRWHTFADRSLLRRVLVDERLMRHTASGNEYQRIDDVPPVG